MFQWSLIRLLQHPQWFLPAHLLPDFVPKIPIFVKEVHGIIPFQTRAPGTVPARLQSSVDYKVACMLRVGTHKVRNGFAKDLEYAAIHEEQTQAYHRRV